MRPETNSFALQLLCDVIGMVDTTPAIYNCGSMRGVQNHVFAAKQPLSALLDHQVDHLAPPFLSQHAPGEKMGVGQPNWAQPITINLPNQHFSKNQHRCTYPAISLLIGRSNRIHAYPRACMDQLHSKNGFGYEDTFLDMF